MLDYLGSDMPLLLIVKEGICLVECLLRAPIKQASVTHGELLKKGCVLAYYRIRERVRDVFLL